MGSGGSNDLLLDASAASSECPRNAASTVTAIVSSTPAPGFLFRASKSSLLDPRAQEFRPMCASMLPLLYPYNYPSVEFHPPLPPPSPSTGPPRFCKGSGRETGTRSLLLSSVPVNVREVCLVRELEVFGPLRAVEMEEIQQGMVTAHFFDVRHAQTALMEIQEQHMLQQSRLAQHYTALMRAAPSGNAKPPPAPPVPRPSRGLIAGCAVWARYCGSPMIGSRLPDAHNQGTLVVFNLDSEVSPSILKSIFEAFGPVRELRETPSKCHHRFVEFYDVRDAARALAEMNGQLICDKLVKIEFSHPGGQARRLRNNAAGGGKSCVPAAFAPDPSSSSSSLHSFPRLADHLPDTRFVTACPSQDTVKREPLTRGPFTTCNSRVVSGAATLAASSDAGQDGKIIVRRRVKSGRAAAGSKSWNVTIGEERRFTIDEVQERSSSVNPRTTVMIKNIPNKYSQKLLLNMLDQHCISCNVQIADENGDDEPLSAYDFVYLPIDFKNKCNVGYGFVNLTSSKATWRLYNAFHKQPWETFNSKKICEVTYARLQGLEALKEHFKNSKFACDTYDEYLPVIFSPARDGKTLSEPTAIGGHANSKSRQQEHSSSCPPPPMPTNEGPSPSSLTIQRHIGGVDSDFTDSAAPADGDLDGDVNIATIKDHRRHHHQQLLPDSGILNDAHHHHDHLLPSSSLFPDTYATTNGNSNGSSNPAVSIGYLLHPHECKHHPSCPQVS